MRTETFFKYGKYWGELYVLFWQIIKNMCMWSVLSYVVKKIETGSWKYLHNIINDLFGLLLVLIFLLSMKFDIENDE